MNEIAIAIVFVILLVGGGLLYVGYQDNKDKKK